MDKRRLILISLFILLTIILIGSVIAIVSIRDGEPSIPVIDPNNPVVDGNIAFPNANQGNDDPSENGGNTIIPDGNTTLPQIPNNPTVQPGISPDNTVFTRKVEQILNENIRNPSLGSQGNLNYYNDIDGRFYRIDDNGIPVPLSDQVFFNVDTVTWAPQKEEAIIEYPDGANIYYDFNTNRQVTLPQHWESFSFAPQGEKIAAKSVGLSPENRWLVEANPDGSSVRLLEALGQNADKVIVDWSPNQQVVGFAQTADGVGFNREEVFLVGRNGENFPSMTVEGRGLETKWSPTGDSLLYSVYSGRSDFKPELWITAGNPEQIGTNRRVIGLNTWPDKCHFASERYLYCAVPEALERGAGFNPELADNSPDLLYRIDTQNGIKTEIPLDREESHIVENMFLSDDGETLYFSDKRREGLFEVSL